jgi:hypothetical protein
MRPDGALSAHHGYQYPDVHQLAAEAPAEGRLLRTCAPDADVLGHVGQLRERYTRRRKLSAVK